MSPNPADYGTAEEAKAMLERAVAAVKENKVKALDTFNKGEGVKEVGVGRSPSEANSSTTQSLG